MNLSEQYQKARQAGYSDEEIMEYLNQKNPDFSKKMQKAEQVGYKPQEIIDYLNKPKELTSGDYAKDFGSQYLQGASIGAIGTYGDILNLFGLQSKDILPGEKEK